MWWSIYHMVNAILNLESEFRISICVMYYSHITVGKTWFSHSRCSSWHKCKYRWYPLILYVWIIFQKRLWHVFVWLLLYNQIKHFSPFPFLQVHPIGNLGAQAWNILHSMYKVSIKWNYKEIHNIGEGTYTLIFKSVMECETCRYHSMKPFCHYFVYVFTDTSNFSVRMISGLIQTGFLLQWILQTILLVVSSSDRRFIHISSFCSTSFGSVCASASFSA
jgi:hypothetical protein